MQELIPMARIKNCSPDDFFQLSNEGFQMTYHYPDTAVIALPVHRERHPRADKKDANNRTSGELFKIPPHIPHERIEFYMAAVEAGGSNGKTGVADIICDVHGRPFLPLRFGYEPNGSHAFFEIDEPIVTITTGKFTPFLTIHKWSLKIKGEKIEMKHQEIFHGSVRELDPSYTKYKEAIKAAINKVNCQNCTRPHFISSTTAARAIS